MCSILNHQEYAKLLCYTVTYFVFISSNYIISKFIIITRSYGCYLRFYQWQSEDEKTKVVYSDFFFK